jgi:hypothetical protein
MPTLARTAPVPASLEPSGSREFGILDPDGSLVTFAERRHG